MYPAYQDRLADPGGLFWGWTSRLVGSGDLFLDELGYEEGDGGGINRFMFVGRISPGVGLFIILVRHLT